MKTLGCYFGKHDLVLVAVNNEFHTSYTDTKRTVYHAMRFYECKNCGHRAFQTNYKNDYESHTGIDNAKNNWIDVRIVPANSYDPRKERGYSPAPATPTPPKTAEVVPFVVIKGDKNE